MKRADQLQGISRRRIIQIAVVPPVLRDIDDDPDEIRFFPTVYAVANDGTLWRGYYEGSKIYWEQEPNLPQDFENDLP